MIKHTILDNILFSDGRNITLDTGFFAKQSNVSVKVSLGNTMLLGTKCIDKEVKENVEILPLTIDYRHNYSAEGKIPVGLIKREVRTIDYEKLVMRCIDRISCTLFPKKIFADIQIIISLLSYDNEILPNGLAALSASDIPFYVTIYVVRLVSLNVGKFIINPNLNEVLNYDIDIIIGGSKESIVMVLVGEMKEALEEELLEAIIMANKAIKNKIEAQVRLAKRGKKYSIKRDYELIKQYKKIYLKYGLDKENLELLKKKVQKKVLHTFYLKLKIKSIRYLIIRGNYRIDGLTSKDIRTIFSTVDNLPTTHVSAFFMRGETQSLTTVTLETSTDINRIDNVIKEINEKFYLHYNFPPYSTGEIRSLRAISRREVGHGNLAQSALKNVIIENIPYTIRVVSDILEYNGFSTMGTASLALMYAGISIKRPVYEIAMGYLIDKEKGKEIILSDIIGFEDFKGAVTKKGLTACQMEIKIEGVSYNILKKVFKQARQGLVYIYEMLKPLSRKECL